VALPAFAAPGDEAPAQVNAVLSGESQSFTVNSAVLQSEVTRDGYSATTAEELEAAERAAAALAAAAKAAANAAAQPRSDTSTVPYTGPTSGSWVRPVSGPISSPYGPRRAICNSAGCSNGFHDGVDFSNTCGTPVVAVSAGRVSFVGNAGAYGNRVIVDHGGGVESIYGHLQSGSFKVSVGDLVTGGTGVASVGATGVVSGCHLDLKVRIDGSFTNPSTFLRARGVSM
jgi:murein DD-endopeptidase MepM/ murein hydrolase activator NlpD